MLRNPANNMQSVLDEYEKMLTNIAEYDALQAERAAEAAKPVTPEKGESPLDFADRVAANEREKQAATEPMMTAEDIAKSKMPQFLKDNALDYINGKRDTVTENAYNVIAAERRAEKKPTKRKTKSETEKKAPTGKKTSEKKPASDKKSVTSQREAAKPQTTEERRAALREKLLRQKEEFKNIGKGRLSSLPVDIALEKAMKMAEIMATSAEIGYTYLLDGVTKVKEWSSRMKEDFGDIFKDTFDYETDAEVDKYIGDLWNASYTDEESGEKRSLAEWADVLAEPAEETAPYNAGDRVIYKGEIAKVHSVEKSVDGWELTLDTGMAPVIYEAVSADEVTPAIRFHQESTTPKASVAAAMAEPKTKDEWISRVYDTYKKWCEKMSVPYEKPIRAECFAPKLWGFAPKLLSPRCG